MDLVLLQGEVDPTNRESIAAFYKYYTNGKMTLAEAARDYGISGLTAAFYINSFRPTKNLRTITIKRRSSI